MKGISLCCCNYLKNHSDYLFSKWSFHYNYAVFGQNQIIGDIFLDKVVCETVTEQHRPPSPSTESSLHVVILFNGDILFVFVTHFS